MKPGKPRVLLSVTFLLKDKELIVQLSAQPPGCPAGLAKKMLKEAVVLLKKTRNIQNTILPSNLVPRLEGEEAA